MKYAPDIVEFLKKVWPFNHNTEIMREFYHIKDIGI